MNYDTNNLSTLQYIKDLYSNNTNNISKATVQIIFDDNTFSSDSPLVLIAIYINNLLLHQIIIQNYV